MRRLSLSALVAIALNACSCGGTSEPAALGIATTALPDGEVDLPYSASLSASGGTAPYQWAVASGTLPAGLSLSTSGTISGTPIVAGTSSFVVTVTDSASPAGTATATLSIAIRASGSSASPLRVTTTSLPGATVGVWYSAPLAASGGTTPISWTLAGGTLPPGLDLSSSGEILGTPTTAGSYGFTLVVVDSSSPQQSASAALSIVVTSTSSTLAVTTANLPQGTVGTSYSQQLAATGGTTPYTWSVPTGTLPDGLLLSTSGLLSGTPTTAGSFTFTVQVEDASATPGLAQATFSVTINPNPAQAVAITTGALPTGTVGHAYLAQLQAAGGTAPYAWAVVAGALPGGLALSPTGSISGTPGAEGSFAFTVEVADASATPHTATKQFTISVAPAPGQSLSIATATLPHGTTGTAYAATITASGGTAPYSFSLAGGALPPGLALADDGTISGTPTIAGSFSFTVRVTDNDGLTADRTLSIIVSPAPGELTITTQTLPPGRTGVAYDATLVAANGTPPYTWSLATDSLPSGLTLSSGGVIGGTPTAAGTFTFTVAVTDGAGTPATASKQLSITIR